MTSNIVKLKSDSDDGDNQRPIELLGGSNRRIILLNKDKEGTADELSVGGGGGAGCGGVIKLAQCNNHSYSGKQHRILLTMNDFNDGFEYSRRQSASDESLVNLAGGTKINLNAINLPEDMRISKLLRRLAGDKITTFEAIDLCGKLKVVIGDPSNSSYIRKSFDILADAIITIIKKGSAEYLDHVAQVFGKMGYVIRNSFSVYKNWIIRNYKSTRNIQVYMIMALTETFRLDEGNYYLAPNADKIMQLLKEFLESVNNPKIFIEITKTIQQICRNYPEAVQPYFQDIVDIVVAWNLEIEQNTLVKMYCGRLLESFRSFWECDIKYTTQLLNQFLEDIQLECADSSKLFGAFVNTYNTVLKCVFTTPDYLIYLVGKPMLIDSFKKISSVAENILPTSTEEEIILSFNEFCVIIIKCYSHEVIIDHEVLFSLIYCQLDNIHKFSDNQILSLLLVIYHSINEIKNHITIEFISKFLKINYLVKFYKNTKVQRLLITIYHEVLNLKNIELLQEAYKIVLNDMGVALLSLPETKCLAEYWTVDTDNLVQPNYTIPQAEYMVNFYLTSLANLAIQTTSIIVMFSLKPSILDLLITHLAPANYTLWKNYNFLHYSVLNLIFLHSRKHSNFIGSSDLLKGDNNTSNEDIVSPTSSHFELILKFLSEILTTNLCIEKFNLVLDYFQFLLDQMSKYADILKTNKFFINIVKNINKITIENDLLDIDTILKCADCIDLLLNSYDTLSSDIYQSVSEICCIHMCSTSGKIRKQFSVIFSKVPLKYTLQQVNLFTGMNSDRLNRIKSLQHWLVKSPVSNNLKPEYFKKFIQKISFSSEAEDIEEFLLEIFLNCWSYDSQKSYDFSRYAIKDFRCLIDWIQWEAANYCVNNKLKTPLGKAQDTFLKIESIIKEDARILALKEKSPVKNIKSLLANQRHTRILLGFLEALEKVIYNAAKGTAFAMPAPDKAVRTFFRVNAGTCHEWFNRIRSAVDLVGRHTGESIMVIRYTEETLKRCVKNNKISEQIFEEALISHAWALFCNGETDSLYGLYIWIKNTTNKKLLWIKMVAEQTAGRREIATEGYLSMLKSSESKSPVLREFIFDQLVLCLIFTEGWYKLREILLEEEARTEPRVTIPIYKINVKQVEDMIQFNETQDLSLIDLSGWECLGDKDSLNDFSYYQILPLAECTMNKYCLSNIDQFDRSLINTCFDVIQNCIQECLRGNSKEHLNHMTINNHVCHKIVQRVVDINETMESLGVDKNYGALTLNRLLQWSEYFDNATEDGERRNIKMRLDLVSMGRKEGNLVFCQTQLNKFFNKSDYAKRENLVNKIKLEEIGKNFIQPSCVMDTSIWNEHMTRGVYEWSKLLYSQPNKKHEAIQLAAAISMGVTNRLKVCNLDSPMLKEQAARILLSLSEWLQGENDTIITGEQNSTLVKLLASLPDVTPSPDDVTQTVIPLLENSVGKLIQHSIKHCNDLGKAWSSLGNWCYKWGRKMVEIRNDDKEKAGLRVSDVTQISNLIPNATKDDLQKICEILNQHNVIAEEEDIDPNEMSSTEMIENQLRTLPTLATRTQDEIHEIIDIWRQAHKSVYGYYEMAANAYFKFLQLNTNNDDEPNNDTNCYNVTATLRLLRLIVKHALGLQEVLEEGLASTPTSPWKVIIPQLFSRMNHHESYVRRRVSELICRVAKDAPHLIIFPTVVGAIQGQKTDLTNISITTEDLDAEDITNTSVVDSALICCFNSLLDTLSQQAPETVNQVQLFVSELKRITLLWDELWLVTLTQIYSEWSKRYATFQKYIQSFKDCLTHSVDRSIIISGKFNLMMKPVIFVIERLCELTSRKAETNNERSFQEKFSKIIEQTVADLKRPYNPDRPNDTWDSFKKLYHTLQQRSQKKSSSVLKMTDISPVLAQLSDTVISMPGVKTNNCEPVYIRSVENAVHILPSKTKPKKLVFIGTDGKRYTYLFKSLEDLHLDERIMQFLSIANTMIPKSIDCNGQITNYRARHYSVIPLGPRSGLINWVDGVVPIFALYKKWQQREAANPKKDQPAGIILRPAEMFYNKLSAHGIKANSNRKEWPVNVLIQVLNDLQAETPNELLAKELWCHSTSATQWRQVIRNYSLSLAVMSVIGYIIGLGDRHLDNILIELSSGEIVHIDYNVCFEKGHTLRVPEKVPFRMTQNLEEALGITGVQGTFWLTCEHVLRALKKGRETLLTLLEAFVYDPLVDWAVGEDCAGDLAVAAYGGEALGGELRQARKQLESELTRDTLAIRFTEIKPDWLHNRDELSKQLILMQDNLNELKEYRMNLQKSETQLDSLTKQMSLIREAESLNSAIESHQLNTVSHRYNTYKMARIDYENSRLSLQKSFCDEYTTHLTNYRNALDNFHRNKIGEQTFETGVSAASEFELIKEFLETSAQGQMYTAGDQLRKELNSSFRQQTNIINQVFDTLVQYVEVMRYCPQSYHNNHRLARYAKWTKSIFEQNTAQVCHDIEKKCHNFKMKSSHKSRTRNHVGQFSANLQKLLTDTEAKMQKTNSRVTSEYVFNQNIAMTQVTYDKSYVESKQAIKLFFEQGANAKQVFDSIVITVVCDINKRFLMIENASSSSGDNLVDLTSNGKWFLDELYLLSSLLNELCCLIQDDKSSRRFKQSTSVITQANQVYSYLRTMNYTFLEIVLPDAIQGIMTEDQTVLDMISTVSSLQTDLLPVGDLLNHLKVYLRNIITNQPVSNEVKNVVKMVEELKNKMRGLKEQYEQDHDPKNLGKTIFLNFIRIFDELEIEHYKLMSAIDIMEYSAEWFKLDQVKDSRILCALVFNKTTRYILENIFAVKRLDVMIEFFTLCLEMTSSFKDSNPSAVICDDERFSRPLKKFIAEYVLRLLLGIGPFAASITIGCLLEQNGMDIQSEINLNDFGAQTKIVLDELCRKSVDTSIKAGAATTMAVNQVNNLCNQLEFTWKKKEVLQHFQESLKFQLANIHRIKTLVTLHQWMQEDVIGGQSGGQNTRINLISKLRSSLHTLTAWKSTINKMGEEISGFVITALQRLKWAAGANPTLTDILIGFEEISRIKREQLEKQCISSMRVISMIQAIVNYEALRLDTAENSEFDKKYLADVKQFEQNLIRLHSCQNIVNPIEEAIVELLDPEGPIDKDWISNVKSLLTDIADQTEEENNLYERKINESQDSLQKCGHKLRQLSSTHHQLGSDVVGLLKTTVKNEHENFFMTKEYLQRHKLFTDTLCDIQGTILSKDFTEQNVEQIFTQAIYLLENVTKVYDDLFLFDNELRDNYEAACPVFDHEKKSGGGGNQYQGSAGSSNTNQNGKKIKGQTEQKRNAYAVSVWRRIRMKLEGRDPDPTRRCTIQEQVNWMIREAMNKENLAVLYEGWTPWI